MVQYFYVTFMSPAGPGAMFFKGEQHPLHKDQMIKFATNVARRIGMQTGNVLLPESINILGVIPLPEDVAKSHFPADFPLPLDPSVTI